MFVKYVTTATSTLAQVISDLALLASGAAVSSLSTGCDKGRTEYVNTVSPGWTVFDSAAPASGQVISAPDADGLTTKYLRLYAYNAASVGVMGYDSWTVGTHTGTNATNQSGSNISWTAGASNTFYMFVTPRTLLLIHPTSGVLIGTVETTRTAGYLSSASYPCFAVINHQSLIDPAGLMYFPTMKSPTAGTALTGASAAATAGTVAGRVGSASQATGCADAAIRDATEVLYHEFRPVYAVYVVNSGSSAMLGKLYDVMEMTRGSSWNRLFDTYTDGTTTYMVVAMNSTTLTMPVA